MKTSVLLKIAGSMNLIFLLFHIPFYWMFGWERTLSCLGADNRNILLTFNVIANVLLFYFTYILLRYTRTILQNDLGKMFLLLIAAFYSIRIFAEFYFWKFNGIESITIIVLCAIPVLCCIVPLMRPNEWGYEKG